MLTHGGGLYGPLGPAMAPGGDLIAVNGNNGNAVEISPAGRQVATVTLVKGGAGDLFGITPLRTGRDCCSSTTARTPWISIAAETC